MEKKERSDLIARYEEKIKELRTLVDEALKEKTRINMEAKVAFTERDNAVAKVRLILSFTLATFDYDGQHAKLFLRPLNSRRT